MRPEEIDDLIEEFARRVRLPPAVIDEMHWDHVLAELFDRCGEPSAAEDTRRRARETAKRAACADGTQSCKAQWPAFAGVVEAYHTGCIGPDELKKTFEAHF